MSRRLVGALKTPGNSALAGTLRFTAKADAAPSLLEATSSEEVLDGSGGYDITLADGSYAVDLKTSKRFLPLGSIAIAAGADTTLNDLLTS